MEIGVFCKSAVSDRPIGNAKNQIGFGVVFGPIHVFKPRIFT
jgi:hypothetical protein